MVSCDGPWTALVMIGGMYVLPFALPLLWLGFWGLRRRAALLALLVASLAGALVWSILLSNTQDGKWPVLAFLPAIAAAAFAWQRTSKGSRLVALACAAVPLVAGVGYILWQRATWVGC